MKPMTRVFLGAGLLAAGGTALAQMGGMGPGRMGGGMGPGASGASFARHRLAMMSGLPAAYAGARNPLPATPANIAAGKALYARSCASCHGKSGAGDGPAAAGLKPPPANLVSMLRMPIATDGYLDWTLSEGGTPVGSAMPPLKASLKPEQVWQIVSYLWTL